MAAAAGPGPRDREGKQRGGPGGRGAVGFPNSCWEGSPGPALTARPGGLCFRCRCRGPAMEANASGGARGAGRPSCPPPVLPPSLPLPPHFLSHRPLPPRSQHPNKKTRQQTREQCRVVEQARAQRGMGSCFKWWGSAKASLRRGASEQRAEGNAGGSVGGASGSAKALRQERAGRAQREAPWGWAEPPG